MAVAETRRAIEEAISEGSPLAPYVRAAAVRQMLGEAELAEGSRLVAGRAGRWLWTVAFTQRWLSDTDFRAAR